MSIMAFNEYQRLLQKRGISEQEAYLHTVVFEQVVELASQLDTQSKLLLKMAEQMEGIVKLHEATQQHVVDLARFGQTPGVEFGSVANDPDKDN